MEYGAEQHQSFAGTDLFCRKEIPQNSAVAAGAGPERVVAGSPRSRSTAHLWVSGAAWLQSSAE